MERPSKKCVFTFLGAIVLVCYFMEYLSVSPKYRAPSRRHSCPRKIFKAKEDINITICTQNIWLQLVPFVGNNSAVPDRLKAFADGVFFCDIVLLQELFIFKTGPLENRRNYVKLTKLMREKGFNYLASSEKTVPKYFGQNSGLVVYSKYRILTANSLFFQDRSFQEMANNKGYIIAEIEVGSHVVYLANTHLDAGDKNVRKIQLLEVISSLWLEIVCPPSFVVLAGDLNISGNDSEFEDVKKIIDKLELKEVFTDHAATYKDGTALDYMFVSQNISINDKNIRQLVMENNEPISDHYALWANLKLSNQD